MLVDADVMTTSDCQTDLSSRHYVRGMAHIAGYTHRLSCLSNVCVQC